MVRGFTFFLLFGFLAGEAAEKDIPIPPVEARQSPKSIIGYFCNQWAKGNYAAMYGALSAERQQITTLEEWETRLSADTKAFGLPVDHEIEGPLKDLESKSLYAVKVQFSNNRVGTLKKKSWAEKLEAGWCIGHGGLGPMVKHNERKKGKS